VAAGSAALPTREFTAQTVHALKARSTRIDYFDAISPGFGIRITLSSVKTWLFIDRVNGNAPVAVDDRALTYRTLSLADARAKMKIAAGGLARHGTDPADEKTHSQMSDRDQSRVRRVTFRQPASDQSMPLLAGVNARRGASTRAARASALTPAPPRPSQGSYRRLGPADGQRSRF
jgi:Arm domain-containing DNA-binding protein